LPFFTFFYLFLPYFTLGKPRFKRCPKKATQNINTTKEEKLSFYNKLHKQKSLAAAFRSSGLLLESKHSRDAAESVLQHLPFLCLSRNNLHIRI
jgi:hypothetical protein